MFLELSVCDFHFLDFFLELENGSYIIHRVIGCILTGVVSNDLGEVIEVIYHDLRFLSFRVDWFLL
jgi:hypothetical protein